MKKMLAALAATVLIFAPAQGAHMMRVTMTGYDRQDAEILTNFPALVVFTNNVGGSAFTFQTHPFINGNDLRFYSESGAPLDYEIDTFTPGVELLAWVKIPELKPDGTTVLYAVWGDSETAQTLPADGKRVWAGDFLLVQHYNENGGANVFDASGNGNHAGIHNYNATVARGRVGNAANLSNGNRANGIFMKDTAGFKVGDTWTLSAWFSGLLDFDPNNSDSWRTLARGPVSEHHIILRGSNHDVGSFTGTPNAQFQWANPATLAPAPGWRQLTAVAGEGTTAFYTNGQFMAAGNFVCDVPIFAIGCYQGGNVNAPTPSQKFADYLDEFRVASLARSSNWVWASFMAEGGDPAFAEYEILPVDFLQVEGSPLNAGEVDPPFGLHMGIPSAFTASVPEPVWTNGAETMIAIATGWKTFEDNGNGFEPVDGGDTLSFDYTHPGVACKIVWYFAVTNHIEAGVSGSNGSVSGGGWHGFGENVVLTAQPVAKFLFDKWTGDVPTGLERMNPLVFACDKPRAIKAVFVSRDTPTTLWTGAGQNPNWNNPDNWENGILPGAAIGALFAAPFGHQPVLNGNYNVQGIWVGEGVDQDVILQSDGIGMRQINMQAGAVFNGVKGGGWHGSVANGLVLLLDAPDRNFTLGAGVRLALPNNSCLAALNNGVLDIQGEVGIPNGEGMMLWSTNENNTIRFSGGGKLTNSGGGNFFMDTRGVVHVDSTEPWGHTKGTDRFIGTLRLTSPLAFTNTSLSVYNNNTSRLELWFDDPPGHPVIHTVNWQGNTTVDVSRETAGDADGKAVRVGNFNLIGGGTTYVSSSHGRTLKADVVSQTGAGSGGKNNTLYPLSGLFDIGTLTVPSNISGMDNFTLGGIARTNWVQHVMDAPGAAISFRYVIGGGATWRLGGAGAHGDSITIGSNGRLIAAGDEALGFGGESRVNNNGHTVINAGGTLDITGAGVTERIIINPGNGGNNPNGALVNDTPGTLGVVRDGVAHLRFTSVGSGFAAADAGKALDLSLGGGIGAAAEISALRLISGDNHSLLSARVTDPGRGGGYRENFGAQLPPGVFATGVAITAVVSAVEFPDHYEWARWDMGGDGDLRIEAPLVCGKMINNTSYGYLHKIRSGTLSITSSNSIPLGVNVAGGAFSVCDFYGAGQTTVSSNAMLAGNGVFQADPYRTRPNNANLIAIQLYPGAGFAPHRGTGLPFATLTCDVTASARPDAMLIEGACFFEFAVGPGGADKLVVIGNLTMNSGKRTVRIVPKPGLTPGRYRVLEWQGNVVDNGAVWEVEPDPKWQVKFTPDATGGWLTVTSPATLLLVR